MIYIYLAMGVMAFVTGCFMAQYGYIAPAAIDLMAAVLNIALFWREAIGRFA